MKKDIRFVISKTLAGKFFITMQGHYPNPDFPSVVSEEKNSYEAIYWIALGLKDTAYLLGNDSRVFNDKYSEEDGIEYCNYMAFPRLKLID